MVFSSMIFLFVFFPVILFGYYGIVNKLEHRNIFLLIASLLFYAWGEPVYIVIMLFSICVNYRVGLLIDSAKNEKQRINILFTGVFINLSFLFVFKYESFVSGELNQLLGAILPVRFTSLELALPIGISFFTFQAISYLIDVYRKDADVQTSLMNLGLYIAFFPQLVAGPIVRYRTIAEEIENRETTYHQFNIGVKRFIIGMSKKIIFANQFALVATASFEGNRPSVSMAWMGAMCYMLQIYFDFSGYSDMAIGLGKMFGFNFTENFNYPYMANSITDFWRRWHISLGSWFRDYVYIPLGGSRVGKMRLIFNLLIVWLLTGIWHGAAWQFIVWGLLYFIILVFEKFAKIERYLKVRSIAIIYRGFTLVSVLVGWVIFGESSLGNGLRHIKSMLGLYGEQELIDNIALKNINNYGTLIMLGVVMATPLLPIILKRITVFIEERTIGKSNQFNIICDLIKTLCYMSLFLLSVSYLAMGAHNPFIYFNF